jgi:hypothetical protein
VDPSDQTIRLYHGSKLIKGSEGWQAITAEVPAGLMELRVTSDARRPAGWKASTSSHSEYEFWTEYISRPGMLHDPILPMEQVNFHVDADLAGDTRAGRRDTIGFDAWTSRKLRWRAPSPAAGSRSRTTTGSPGRPLR